MAVTGHLITLGPSLLINSELSYSTLKQTRFDNTVSVSILESDVVKEECIIIAVPGISRRFYRNRSGRNPELYGNATVSGRLVWSDRVPFPKKLIEVTNILFPGSNGEVLSVDIQSIEDEKNRRLEEIRQYRGMSEEDIQQNLELALRSYEQW